MKNRKTSIILIGIGLLFLLNAIFGRYLVLPGYLAGLEAGGNTLEGASQVASPLKIVRYLLWAYSFKLGIYFIILGPSLERIFHPAASGLSVSLDLSILALPICYCQSQLRLSLGLLVAS